MGLDEPRWCGVHIDTELCVQEGGGGITSSQLTGTSFQYHLEGDYPSSREGGDRENRSKRSEVTDRIGSASGLRVRRKKVTQDSTPNGSR